MGTLTARVVAFGCIQCRDLLLDDCRKFNLPLPIGEFIVVPEEWAYFRCPHMKHGFMLAFGCTQTGSAEGRDEVAVALARREDGVEVAPPEWWNNLDASKNIGYPVREEGRYGSYPSIDAYGDESDP